MTIKSMTGFGSGRFEENNYSYLSEVKSLNSRFLDINVRLPRSLAALEHKVISIIKSHVSRGKIEINFDISSNTRTDKLPNLNEEAIDHYLELSEKIKARLSYEAEMPSIHQLLRLDGALEYSRKSNDYSELHEKGILESTKLAAIELVAARACEGEKLELALKELLSQISTHREQLLLKITTIQNELIDQTKKKIQNIFKARNSVRENT